MKINSNIEQIKKDMKEKKITQSDLEKLSGVPLPTIRQIFRGYTKNPGSVTMDKIKKAVYGDSFVSNTQDLKQMIENEKLQILNLDGFKALEEKNRIITANTFNNLVDQFTPQPKNTPQPQITPQPIIPPQAPVMHKLRAVARGGKVLDKEITEEQLQRALKMIEEIDELNRDN